MAQADVVIAANARGANAEINAMRTSIEETAQSAERASSALAGAESGAGGLGGKLGGLSVIGKSAAAAMGDMHGVGDNLNKLMGNLGGNVGKVTGAVKGLAGGLAAGGPLGLAMGAAAIGIGLLVEKFTSMKKAAKDASDATVDAAETLADKIRKFTEQTTRDVEKMLGAGFGEFEIEIAKATNAAEQAEQKLAQLRGKNLSLIARQGEKAVKSHRDAITAAEDALEVARREKREAIDELPQAREIAAIKRDLDAEAAENAKREAAKRTNVRKAELTKQKEIDHEAALLAQMIIDVEKDKTAALEAEAAQRAQDRLDEAEFNRVVAEEEWSEWQKMTTMREREHARHVEQMARDHEAAEREKVRAVEAAEREMARTRETFAAQMVGIMVSATDQFVDSLADAVTGNEIAWGQIATDALKGVGTIIVGYGAQMVASGIAKLFTPAAAVGVKEIASGSAVAGAGLALGGAGSIISSLMAQASGSGEDDRERFSDLMSSGGGRAETGGTGGGVVVQHHYHASVIGDPTESARRVASDSERARRELLSA
jgi:hypothetical protein